MRPFALIGLALGLVARPVPGQPAGAPVVIYLHGRIVEEQGAAAISPEFGAYAYHAILDSLRAGGVRVIAELRPSGTDPARYAVRVASQVDSLLKAGVPPSQVAVVGFSKGGGIAILAAARLRRPDLTFVFLAACGGTGEAPDLAVAGRLLSVFEGSDPLGQSCGSLFSKAVEGSIHEERRIDTGLRHGAFYRPIPDWLRPIRAWIRGERTSGG
jgi:dienelactone hydrolase